MQTTSSREHSRSEIVLFPSISKHRTDNLVGQPASVYHVARQVAFSFVFLKFDITIRMRFLSTVNATQFQCQLVANSSIMEWIVAAFHGFSQYFTTSINKILINMRFLSMNCKFLIIVFTISLSLLFNEPSSFEHFLHNGPLYTVRQCNQNSSVMLPSE